MQIKQQLFYYEKTKKRVNLLLEDFLLSNYHIGFAQDVKNHSLTEKTA